MSRVFVSALVVLVVCVAGSFAAGVASNDAAVQARDAVPIDQPNAAPVAVDEMNKHDDGNQDDQDQSEEFQDDSAKDQSDENQDDSAKDQSEENQETDGAKEQTDEDQSEENQETDGAKEQTDEDQSEENQDDGAKEQTDENQETDGGKDDQEQDDTNMDEFQEDYNDPTAESEAPSFMETEDEVDLETNEHDLESNEELADHLDDSTVPDMRFRQVPNTIQPTGNVPVVTDPSAASGVSVLKANSGANAGDATKGVTLLSKDGLAADQSCACLGQPQCGCNGGATVENGVRIIRAGATPTDATKLTVIPQQSSTVIEA